MPRLALSRRYDAAMTTGAVGASGAQPSGPQRGPGDDFPQVLTTAMAAELLSVHVEYLRRMVREGRIPAHRFPQGREIRFLRDELIQWVADQPGHDRSPSAERAAADEHAAAGD